MKPTRTPRARDLTGQRFGSLTVLGRHGSSAAGNAIWLCRCDCGNATTSAGSDLRRGRTQTCGCGAAQATRARHAAGRDLAGERFGRLVVIEFAGMNDYPRATWRCTCDCGAEVVATGHHLKDGTTVSCGCRRDEVMSWDPAPWLTKDEIGYTAAHGRVKRLHGPASEHLCVDCLGVAEDWSYDHADPDQRVDTRGRPYSMNPAHYWPRCRSCHKTFDSAAKGAVERVARDGETA